MSIVFSDEQKDAIRAVNKGITLFALCGYAGTGKSTVSKALLDLLSVRYNPDKIVCCALSGIASDRIRKLTGYKAQTIYSLVLAHEKLPYDVVLVDESSMVNTELLFKLDNEAEGERGPYHGRRPGPAPAYRCGQPVLRHHRPGHRDDGEAQPHIPAAGRQGDRPFRQRDPAGAGTRRLRPKRVTATSGSSTSRFPIISP